MAYNEIVHEAQLYFKNRYDGEDTVTNPHYADFKANGKVDGLLGPITTTLVKDFQKEHGRKVTGVLDKNTIEDIRTAILNENESKKNKPVQAVAAETSATQSAVLTIQAGAQSAQEKDAINTRAANSDIMGSKPMSAEQGEASIAHYNENIQKELSRSDQKVTARGNQQTEDALGIYAKSQTQDLPKFGPGSQFAVIQNGLNVLTDGFLNLTVTTDGIDDGNITRERLSKFLGKNVVVNGHIDPAVITPETIAILGKTIDTKLQEKYLNNVIDKTDHPLTDHQTMAGLGIAGKQQWHGEHPEAPGSTPQVQVAQAPTSRDK